MALPAVRWRSSVSEAPPGFEGPRLGREDQPALTDEQRMLLDLRDVLYEGSWEDFRHDLKARRESRPYVFEIMPASPRLMETIERHLRAIDELERWEHDHGRRLRCSAAGRED